MRYHICGAGSIGSLLGWHMRRILSPDDALSLIIRPHQLAELRTPRSPSITLRDRGGYRVAGGFQIEAMDDSKRFIQDLAVLKATREVDVSSPRNHPPYGHIHSLFITTKAHHAAWAMEELVRSNRVSPLTTVVILTNGMGVYEQLVESFFPNPSDRPQFILATNTHGAYTKRLFDVIHSARGQIHYGVVPDPLGRDQKLGDVPKYQFSPSKPPVPDPDPFASADVDPIPQDSPPIGPFHTLHKTISMLEALSPHLSIRREPIEQLHQRLILKLVTNCCINPLTAIKGCRNGDLFGDKESHLMIRQVCEEAGEILKKKAVEDHANYDEELVLTDMPKEYNRLPFIQTPTAKDLEDEVLRIVRSTGPNFSSMLQDVRRKKKTEISFLNGYLSRLGETYGVLTPRNDWLAEKVKQLEPESFRTPLPGERISLPE